MFEVTQYNVTYFVFQPVNTMSLKKAGKKRSRDMEDTDTTDSSDNEMVMPKKSKSTGSSLTEESLASQDEESARVRDISGQ